jgi:hypothetical protein
MSNEFDFSSLELIEVPVKIKDKSYVLREASEDASAKYRNKQIESTIMVDGKPSGIRGLADAGALLVASCLWVRDEKGAETGQVPLSFVKALPYRISKKLFEKAKEISELKDTFSREELLKQKEDIDRQLRELTIKEETGKDVLGNGSSDMVVG